MRTTLGEIIATILFTLLILFKPLLSVPSVQVTKATDIETQESVYTLGYTEAKYENELTCYYYFNDDLNSLLYVDNTGKVLYPDEYEGEYIQDSEGYEIVTEDIVIDEETYNDLSKYY